MADNKLGFFPSVDEASPLKWLGGEHLQHNILYSCTTQNKRGHEHLVMEHSLGYLLAGEIRQQLRVLLLLVGHCRRGLRVEEQELGAEQADALRTQLDGTGAVFRGARSRVAAPWCRPPGRRRRSGWSTPPPAPRCGCSHRRSPRRSGRS